MTTSGKREATSAQPRSLLNAPPTTTKPLLVVLKAPQILVPRKPFKAFPAKSFRRKTLLNKKYRQPLKATSIRQIHYGGLPPSCSLTRHSRSGCARLISAARTFHPHQLVIGDQRCKGRIKEQPLLDQPCGVLVPARAQIIDCPVIQARHQICPRIKVLRIRIETDTQQLDPFGKLLLLQSFDTPVVEELAQQLHNRNLPQSTSSVHRPAVPFRSSRLDIDRTALAVGSQENVSAGQPDLHRQIARVTQIQIDRQRRQAIEVTMIERQTQVTRGRIIPTDQELLMQRLMNRFQLLRRLARR